MKKSIKINDKTQVVISKKEYEDLKRNFDKSDRAFANMRREIHRLRKMLKVDAYEKEIEELNNTIEWYQREVKRARKNLNPDVRVTKLTHRLIKATERGNRYLIELNKEKRKNNDK